MTGTCQQPSPAENRLSLSWLRSPEPHLWCKSVPSRIKKVECVFGNDLMRFFLFSAFFREQLKILYTLLLLLLFSLCQSISDVRPVAEWAEYIPKVDDLLSNNRQLLSLRITHFTAHPFSFPQPSSSWLIISTAKAIISLRWCVQVQRCSRRVRHQICITASFALSLSLSLYLCSIKKQSILGVNWYQSLFCSALRVCLHWSVVLQLSLSIGAFFSNLYFVLSTSTCARVMSPTHTQYIQTRW